LYVVFTANVYCSASYATYNTPHASPVQFMLVFLDIITNSTNTIADNRLQFGTSIGVQPQIQQLNSGAFNINTPITTTAPGLELTGDGTGVVTLGGVIDGGGAINKTGTSTFDVSGANTYPGNTTLTAGPLRQPGP